LVVLLDDAERQVIERINGALDHGMDGDPAQARKSLEAIARTAGRAERKAVELARNYLDQPHRLHVKGLEKKDIIEYLDPEFFQLTMPWPQLRREYARSDSGSDFKGWLRQTHGAVINESRLRKAAGKLSDNPPSEFTDLLDFCQRLSAGGSA
jgi:hypothetical protein